MPRSLCSSNGMAYHWIAQALRHCITNTQSIGNHQQGHPKPTATSGTQIFGAVNRHSRVAQPPMHLRQGLGGGPEKLQRLKYCKRERLPTVWNTGA